jgi:small nuclear ribonucleoprotein (snRNP)-like protein
VPNPSTSGDHHHRFDRHHQPVTLTATGSTVTEGGQITYTATLTNPAQTPVTVTLSNGSTITIGAGQTTGTVNVPTAANDVYNNGVHGQHHDHRRHRRQLREAWCRITTPATTTVTDSIDTTSVSLTATGTVVEGGQITYTATLTNAAQTPVTITLSNGSTITIEAGKTTGSVNVPTAANDVYNNGSTVSTTITGASGGNFENLVPEHHASDHHDYRLDRRRPACRLTAPADPWPKAVRSSTPRP